MNNASRAKIHEDKPWFLFNSYMGHLQRLFVLRTAMRIRMEAHYE